MFGEPPQEVAAYWGLDVNTRRVSLGVARAAELAWRTLSLEQADGGPRRLAAAHRDLWAFFAGAVHDFGVPARVAVEQPFAATMAQVHPESLFMLGVVQAVLAGVLPRQVPIDLLPVGKWKLPATGHGVATIPTILSHVCPKCAAAKGVRCGQRFCKERRRKAEKQRLLTWARSRGYDGLLSDEADALGISVACQVLSGRGSLLSAQTTLPLA